MSGLRLVANITVHSEILVPRVLWRLKIPRKVENSENSKKVLLASEPAETYHSVYASGSQLTSYIKGSALTESNRHYTCF